MNFVQNIEILPTIEIGSDVIAYPTTEVGAIISQLKDQVKKTRELYHNKEQIFHNQLYDEEKRLQDFYNQWRQKQTDIQIGLGIVEAQRDKELTDFHHKIARYTILKQYGPYVCVRAYQIAEKANVDRDVDLLQRESEKEVLVYQIAYDLIQGKLGVWPSRDVDLWFDFAQLKINNGETFPFTQPPSKDNENT